MPLAAPLRRVAPGVGSILPTKANHVNGLTPRLTALCTHFSRFAGRFAHSLLNTRIFYRHLPHIPRKKTCKECA